MTTPKELLDEKLALGDNEFTTLRYIFEIFNGEGQFGDTLDTDGYRYCRGSFDGFYESVAQKIIDAVTDHNPRNWRMEPGEVYVGTGEDTRIVGFQPELKIIKKVNP